MSERRLSDLPGYQQLGTIDPIEAYLAEKRGTLGSGAAQYLSDVALQGGGLHLEPDAIEQIAARGRDEAIRRQGTAPYASALARRLVMGSVKRGIISAPTEKTALTTLFQQEYGVDIEPYMQESTNMLGITGICDKGGAPVVGLNYMALRETHGNIFWQLTIDGVYGFVNMYCVQHDFNTFPITGSGNIAAIPGVEQALTDDVAFIEKNNIATG
jgi:hypothetical protein